MNTKGIALLSAAALLAAASASANPLTWTEAGIGYNRADAGEETADALDIRGGVGFAGIGHAQLTWTDGSVDGGEGDPDFDFDGFELRAGVHPSVGANTQLVGDVMYFDYDGDFDAEEDGWGLGFGIRHKLGDQFEIRAQIDYYDGEFTQGSFSEDFNNTVYSFGGRYYWLPNVFTGVSVAVGGAESFSIAEGGDVIRVDAGWSFGGDAF